MKTAALCGLAVLAALILAVLTALLPDKNMPCHIIAGVVKLAGKC